MPATTATESMRLVHVAVPVPALESLTYSLPDGIAAPPVGARVRVPLGNRVLTGCVVPGEGSRGPAFPGSQVRFAGAQLDAAVKPVLEVLDTTPFLPEDVVQLA